MSDQETLDPTPERSLKRNLTNRHVQLIAIGGAIGTGLFMGSGKTIATSGPSVLLVYVIIGAVLFLFMRTMGELLLSDERYTTFADIARDLIGPWAGFVTGWTYWMCWVVTGVADMVAITGYVRFWWPNTPAWIPIIAMTILLFSLNAMTVKAFGETEFWFALVKILAILALVAVGIAMVALGTVDDQGSAAAVANLWSRGGFFPTGFTGFLGGFQIALFAFVGIELVGTTVAETADPEKTLPKAINSIPVRIMLFYVAALAAIMMVTPWDQVDPERSPFVTMFSMTGLGAAATIVNLVVLTSAASSANSGIYSTSRMLFGLAKRGDAPKIFSRLSKRHVPRNALFLSCVLLLSAIILMASGDSISAAFTLVTSMSATLFMGVWVVIVVSYLLFLKRRPELHEASTFTAPGGALAAWTVLVFMAAMLVVLALFPDTRAGLLTSLIWIVFIVAAALVHRHRMLARAEADPRFAKGARER
ncbi:MAG: amino acid permease [Schaalia hyovaginalis]|uniref:amino acid permease n=1 Tax=Schaalia hyovaginalis TaxID=29316 RepID=UPI0026EFA297|nr:amino acid permease [Schaalia hyovaginalis]MCI7512251.1 amino acid permease [Schaalia hyovaginalis]MDY4263568.1 amino acid permease [Schaalia hyovaginalis]